MKGFFKEFREFIQKGNVLDLAVGVIIGGAFQAIVNSLVGDILSPLLGLFAKQDFSTLAIKIWDVEIKYGAFINAVINFLIMALVIFIIVKSLNKVKELAEKRNKVEEAAEEATTKECPFCKSEIAIGATRCPHCTSELDK